VKLELKNIAELFSGFSEAWIQEDYPTRSCIELLDLVRVDEDE